MNAIHMMLIKGVRVEDDKVIISVKGGNEAARWLCGEIIAEREVLKRLLPEQDVRTVKLGTK